MDEFEVFDELFPDEGEDETPNPSYRVTIRAGRVMLTSWVPWLAQGGPNTNLLRERDEAGIVIADLTLLADEKEVAVRFYADGGDRDEAERLLIEWARAVGYRRVWLSNRLEELEPEPEKLDTAHVRCPTCRVEWRDSSPELWLTVRKNGAFPIWCAICGHELPQWVVGRPRARRRRREADRGSPGSWHAARSREKSGRQEG